MNHDLLTAAVKENACPHWTCGKCRKGVVSVRADSFTSVATAYSEAMWEVLGDPECMQYLFSIVADCSTPSCRESYIISGTCRWHFSSHPLDPNGESWRVLDVKSVFPALALIECPSDVPEKVVRCLDRASILFWSDKSACLNALRASIEAVCDGMKIRKMVTANGKRHYLSLHQRIEQLRSKNPDVADTLLAAKWLGNAGSHHRVLPSIQDTIHAISMVEYSLVKLFGTRDKEILKVAKRVNRKKGI